MPRIWAWANRKAKNVLPTSTAIIWPEEVKAEALRIRRENPEASWPDICEAMEIEPWRASALRKACNRYAQGLVDASSEEGESGGSVAIPGVPAELGLSIDRSDGKIEVAYASDDGSIKTLDQLLEAVDADMSVWRVTQWKPNTWEGFAKDNDGKVVKVRLFQAKAILEPIQDVLDTRAAVSAIIEDLAAASPRVAIPAIHFTPNPGTLLEVAIADLHVGKLAHSEEVGQDYDHKLALRAYEGAVGRLVGMSDVYRPERILMPIGNDLLHVDATIGGSPTTTAGTPQDVSARWAILFRAVHRTITSIVESLAANTAPVDIIVVPGNHDTQRTWMIGEVLAAHFHNNAHVNVTNVMTPHQLYAWGEVLLGYCHGHDIKPEKLPMLMAKMDRGLWAAARHCEWHTGHIHTKRELMEEGGVRVRTIPSMCPPDYWHASRGYSNRQCAEAYVWDKRTFRAMFSVDYEEALEG